MTPDPTTVNILFRGSVRDLQFEVGPAASFVESKDRNQQSARPDEEELQHFIEDCRA